MPKATQKSHRVPDTYTNEGQEEFSNIQEALSENELQEDYNRSRESSSDDPEVFFNPNLPQVTRSKRNQTRMCICHT